MTLKLRESEGSLETEADKIRNHLTPIMTYSKLILDGKMGKVSEMHRKKIQVIITEAERINDLLKTFNKEEVSKSSSIKNEIVELELKLALSKQELKHKVQQIQQLKKEEKKQFRNDINAISSQIITVQNKVNKNTRLLFFTVLLSIITVAGFLIFNMDYEKGSTDGIAPLTSKYLIENLRGDTIDTGSSWKLGEGESLYVNIINSANISEDNLERVKNAIFSEDVIDIDNFLLHKGPAGTYSTYYLGWQGALKSAAKSETKLVIPTKFEIVESSVGVGDISITLTGLKDTDGYSGFTKSIADESENQILKSQITIYEADKLTGNQIDAILRHEMGHALGLAHSTAPEDLMAPKMQTEYPFISPCDVDAIISLYDGQSSSQVVCQI
ncbi:MAG: matrixin family metalloprotease [Thaumarchaeota archaeon]|nr:matrixin family metalloprotease [Nitrososphaerota archaeon]